MIKHIRITNYKSLRDVSVDLGPVTVLIGRSGTGKTNLVEALRFLRDCIVNQVGKTPAQYGGWSRIISAPVANPVGLTFTVVFDAPGVEQDFKYTLAFKYPNGQTDMNFSFQQEELELGSEVLFAWNAGKGWLHPPKMQNPPRPGGLMLGTLTGYREATVAALVLSQGIGWYAFADDVLLSNSRNGQPTKGLSDSGANYLQALADISNNLIEWGHYKEMVAGLRQLKPSIASVELVMPSQDRVVVGHDIDGKLLVLDLSQESEGFRRFLAYLIALYQTPAKQTLIFEEPEKGIHPGALGVLAEQFNACPAAGRGQVILTSHSPEFLDHFNIESLRVVEMENYETKIGPVAEEQVEAVRERLLHPGELLTVDPARLATTMETSQANS